MALIDANGNLRWLSALRLLRAILVNPIDVWSQEHFRSLFVVMRTPFGTRAVVSDPKAIKRILVDNASNYRRDDLQRRVMLRTTGRSVFFVEDAQWRLQRRALAPFFSLRAMQAYLAGMIEASQALVERVLGLGEDADIEIAGEMATTTVDVLARTLFPVGLGEPAAAVGVSVRRFSDVTGRVSLGDLMGLSSWAPDFRMIFGRGAVRAVRRRARRVVALARSGSEVRPIAADVVAALTAARDPDTGDALSEREIEDNVSTLIGAGSDTVAMAMTWTLFLLAQAPDIRAKVEMEIDSILGADPVTLEALERLVWTRAAIEEAMRLYPPAPAIGRVAIAADRLGEIDWPAGGEIMIAPWVLHRHELLWSEPERFDPTRFLPEHREKILPFSYLPFGAGPRICLGIAFAMQEAVVVLATLLQTLRFDRADDRPIRLRHCITLQPRDGIHMRASRRRVALENAKP